MLSPNSIPSKRTRRASGRWSIDSGYGSGIHEDAKFGSTLDSRDISSRHVVKPSISQPVGLGINGLSSLQLDDQVAIKQEDQVFGLDTPRLRVCTAFSNTSSPGTPSPTSPVEVKRSRAGKSSKLPSQAVGQLNAWLDANRHHPYPDAQTKQALAEACGITVKQVTTWFTNTRQRQLKSQENDFIQSGDRGDQTPTQASRKGKKKDYRRSNGASPIDGFLSPPQLSPCASMSENSSGEGDNWQCTFCRASLTSKSWRRHEETQHYPKYQWTCLAFGPRIPVPSSSGSICAFCELSDPDDDHFRQFHRIGDCLCKDQKERTFGRPDHLQQHAKNFHKITQPLSELVRDTWRKDGPGLIADKSWTCGFCHEVLSTWDARETHIAGHFKNGRTMAHWRENRSRSALPEGDISLDESAALDALASMGATIAGPSNTHGSQFGHNYTGHMSAFIDPASSTNAHVPSIVQQDLGQPFWATMYGNEVVSSGPSEFPCYQTTMSDAIPDLVQYDAGMPVGDDIFAGIDLYQNPVYYSPWPQQQ